MRSMKKRGPSPRELAYLKVVTFIKRLEAKIDDLERQARLFQKLAILVL